MDCPTVGHQVRPGQKTGLQRRLDVIEVDVRREPVDPGIRAPGLGPEEEPALGEQVRQDF